MFKITAEELKKRNTDIDTYLGNLGTTYCADWVEDSGYWKVFSSREEWDFTTRTKGE